MLQEHLSDKMVNLQSPFMARKRKDIGVSNAKALGLMT
jgi:hypothetical protein